MWRMFIFKYSLFKIIFEVTIKSNKVNSAEVEIENSDVG